MHTADLMTASFKTRFHAIESSFPQTHTENKTKDGREIVILKQTEKIK